MAQHFLPRFLLKGFASRTAGDEIHSWVFYIGKESAEVKTRKIAAEKKFYSAGAELDVDAAITELEHEWSRLLDDLRQEPASMTLTSDTINEFIANLLVRTQSLRAKVLTSVESVIDFISTRLQANPKLLSRFAQSQVKKLAEDLIMRAERGGHHPTRYQKQQLLAEVERMADSQAATIAPMVAKQFADQIKLLPKVVKASHVKAMAEQPVPRFRVEALRGLTWSLVVKDDGTYVLGDIGPVCTSRQSNRFEYLPKAEDIASIILPISHERAIVGNDIRSPIHLDPEAVNKASVSCSSKFFISDRRSAKELRYLPLLGTNSMMLSDEDMARWLEEILRESL